MPMDPEAQRVVDLIALAGKPLNAMHPAAARAQYRAQRRVVQPDPEAVADTRDLEGGGVRLRYYEGVDAQPGHGLLFCHGGGWVVGDLESHDRVCRALANRAGCRVVAVDYRLAPEHPFPAAVEDAVAAYRWVMENAAALGIAPGMLAVGGDSAGGNLAAVLALMGRDGSLPAPCFQMLVYPATDLAAEGPAYDRFDSGVTLTAEAMRWFRDQYLGPPGPESLARQADWRASPARADLAGVAPAFILTAGYDPLCDEGVAYARALDAAGVHTTHLHMPTQVHGFLTMGRMISAAGLALDVAGAMLRQAWHTAG